MKSVYSEMAAKCNRLWSDIDDMIASLERDEEVPWTPAESETADALYACLSSLERAYDALGRLDRETCEKFARMSELVRRPSNSKPFLTHAIKA